MKIGILTFWWANDNYGQLLQCYALQKYLRDLGHDAFLIRYKPANDARRLTFKERALYAARHPVQTLGIISAKFDKTKPLHTSGEEERKRNFDGFRNEYIVSSERIYTSYKELAEQTPFADMYIVGSDQIWNFETAFNMDVINGWFLNFVPRGAVKGSYAASFGRNALSLDVQKAIKPLLKDFDFVTVRENSGAAICKKMGVEANVVCDPTLLLSKQQYCHLFAEIQAPKKKYVFLYLLSNTCSFSVRKLSAWCRANDLELVYVSGNVGWKMCDYDDGEIEKSYLTIPEWLAYLSNAEYVITNSFHCSLFSLLFEKKVAVVPLRGSVKNTNNRIDSLFSNLKVHKSEIKKNDFITLLSLRSQEINTDFIERSRQILNSFFTGVKKDIS